MSQNVREGFNIQVSLFVDPNKLDEFFSAIETVCEKAKADPRCLFFEAYQAQDNPSHIRLVENWNASLEWFMTERAQEDYVKEYIARVEPLMIKPREVQIFNRLSDFYRVKGEE